MSRVKFERKKERKKGATERMIILPVIFGLCIAGFLAQDTLKTIRTIKGG